MSRGELLFVWPCCCLFGQGRVVVCLTRAELLLFD